MPARGQRKPWPFLAPEDPLGMPALRLSWIEALKTRGFSEAHVQNCESALGAFVLWAQERGIAKARDVKKLSPFAATEGRQMSRCSTQPRAGSA